jgi:hypothetical protein
LLRFTFDNLRHSLAGANGALQPTPAVRETDRPLGYLPPSNNVVAADVIILPVNCDSPAP